MMSKATFFGFSVLLAGIIALIRFRKMNRVIFPFIICLWAAGCNEILSYFLWKAGLHTAVNNNIYVLVESILFIWFFKNIGLFDKMNSFFLALLSSVLVLWFWENILDGKIELVSSWFRIAYSFFIVLMSITTINKLVLLDINKPLEVNNKNIFRNPVFLICLGSIVFFTFKLIIEIFWLYGINRSESFRIQLYNILIYINLSVNLVYALAVLWMPPKQQYIRL